MLLTRIRYPIPSQYRVELRSSAVGGFKAYLYSEGTASYYTEQGFAGRFPFTAEYWISPTKALAEQFDYVDYFVVLEFHYTPEDIPPQT